VDGVPDPENAIAQLEKEISNRISPPIHATIDVHETGGKKIIRVLVPRGSDPPYAVDDSKIYVRSETETGLAVRDEIVGLVLRSPSLAQHAGETQAAAEPVDRPGTPVLPRVMPVNEVSEASRETVAESEDIELAPRTGVEVVSVEERNGGRYFTVRDLRNGNVVKNVTRTSARRLWHYAISEYARLPADLSHADVKWEGNLGLLGAHKQGKGMRYDLVQRAAEGNRFFFGVTEDGIHGPWKALVGQEDE
jgi:hypothetical protein